MPQSRSRVVYEFGGYRLDPASHQLLRANGERVPLTPRVFDTLVCLVEHQGDLLDKSTLLNSVWPNVVVEENSLSQSISALRQALGDSRGDHRFTGDAGWRIVLRQESRGASC